MSFVAFLAYPSPLPWRCMRSVRVVSPLFVDKIGTALAGGRIPRQRRWSHPTLVGPWDHPFSIVEQRPLRIVVQPTLCGLQIQFVTLIKCAIWQLFSAREAKRHFSLCMIRMFFFFNGITPLSLRYCNPFPKSVLILVFVLNLPILKVMWLIQSCVLC